MLRTLFIGIIFLFLACAQPETPEVFDLAHQADVDSSTAQDLLTPPDLLSLAACTTYNQPLYSCVSPTNGYTTYGGLGCVACQFVEHPCIEMLYAHYVVCVGNCIICWPK